MPFCETLSIAFHHQFTGKNMWNILNSQVEGQQILPKLRHLTIQGDNLAGEELEEFVNSRRHPNVVHIEEIHLKECRRFKSEVACRLEQQGIKITVRNLRSYN